MADPGAFNVQLLGLKRLVNRLRRIQDKMTEHGTVATVSFGYSARYALYQHEDLTYKHKAGQSAKFLSIPMAEKRVEIGKVIFNHLTVELSIQDAMVAAADYILQQAEQIIPVVSGHMRDSWFIKDTEGNLVAVHESRLADFQVE